MRLTPFAGVCYSRDGFAHVITLFTPGAFASTTWSWWYAPQHEGVGAP